MDLLKTLLLLVTLSGCASLQTHYHEDPFRNRIRLCATVLDSCKVSSW